MVTACDQDKRLLSQTFFISLNFRLSGGDEPAWFLHRVKQAKILSSATETCRLPRLSVCMVKTWCVLNLSGVRGGGAFPLGQGLARESSPDLDDSLRLRKRKRAGNCARRTRFPADYCAGAYPNVIVSETLRPGTSVSWSPGEGTLLFVENGTTPTMLCWSKRLLTVKRILVPLRKLSPLTV